MAQLIYEKNIEMLAHFIPFYTLYYTDYLPRHLEEALLIATGYGYEETLSFEKMKAFDFGGFHIREQTIKKCYDFLDACRRHNAGNMSFEQLSEKFGNTYWYFYLFTKITYPEKKAPNTSYDI
jgi:hypothetical protein